MTHYPTIPALSFEPKNHLLVPEQEIMRVLQFLGFQMIAGQVDVELFDQVTNTLIRICTGDFQCELIEIKTRIKFFLDQCQGDR